MTVLYIIVYFLNYNLENLEDLEFGDISKMSDVFHEIFVEVMKKCGLDFHRVSIRLAILHSMFIDNQIKLYYWEKKQSLKLVKRKFNKVTLNSSTSNSLEVSQKATHQVTIGSSNSTLRI